MTTALRRPTHKAELTGHKQLKRRLEIISDVSAISVSEEQFGEYAQALRHTDAVQGSCRAVATP
jgi:hypothetical protein